MNTLERIKEIVLQQTGDEPESISYNTPFADMGLDSIDRVELVMEIEEEFDIDLPDDKVDEFLASDIQQLAYEIDRQR